VDILLAPTPAGRPSPPPEVKPPRVAVSCSLGSSASLSLRNFLEIVWHKEIVVLQKNLHIPGVVRYLEADMDM
jgi:hypothetical protein